VGEVLALAVWFLFGAVLVPFAFSRFEIAILVYALLSLTVIRCLPVAISLIGSGLDRQTLLFVGWFGPRGLASVVFALLAVEELGEGGPAAPAVAVVAFTVLLSVVLHGLSAGPFAERYARSEHDHGELADGPRSRRSPESDVRPVPGAVPDGSPEVR
jgi:NhaP-type Na+/H+ or K+/H+ antiporter